MFFLTFLKINKEIILTYDVQIWCDFGSCHGVVNECNYKADFNDIICLF